MLRRVLLLLPLYWSMWFGTFLARGWAVETAYLPHTVTTYAGGPGEPVDGLSGLSSDPTGAVYVFVTENHSSLYRLGADGSIQRESWAELQLNKPRCMAVDRAGNRYVGFIGDNFIGQFLARGAMSMFAGSLSPGSSDGDRFTARFRGITGMVVDNSGNLLVVDYGNSSIRRVTAEGVVTTLAGLSGTTGAVDGAGNAARFNLPWALTIDGEGNVYVADTGNHAIRKVTPGGVVTTLAGSLGQAGVSDGVGGGARFSSPQGITIDASGNLFVADTANHAVRKVSPLGEVTTLAGQAGVYGRTEGRGAAARFAWPVGVAIDERGRLIVADRENKALRVVTMEGVVSTLRGIRVDGPRQDTQLYYPQAVAVDPAGSLFVLELRNCSVRKIPRSGEVGIFAGLPWLYGEGSADGRGADARFRQPEGIAADALGNVFVSDTGNHTVRKITSDGMVTTLAGKTLSRGSEDGLGADARFDSPGALTVDRMGNVYVADMGNRAIRKISPGGQVTTLTWLREDGIMISEILLSGGRSLAIDPDGNFYFASVDGNIQTLTNAGALSAVTADSFGGYFGLASDVSGNLYATTRSKQVVRVAREGAPVFVAGVFDEYASAVDGVGDAARFRSPSGIAVDANGVVFVADAGAHSIRQLTPPAPSLRWVRQPSAQRVATGDTVVFSAAVEGFPTPTYQWKRNGIIMSGETGSLLQLRAAAADDGAVYVCVVTNAAGSVASEIARLAVAPVAESSRLSNLSVRAVFPSAGFSAEITVGFVLVGPGSKPVLVRAVGPSLASFGVAGSLPDPTMTFFRGRDVVAANDNWGGAPLIAARGAQVGAFPLASATSRDAVLALDLSDGAYTAQIRRVGQEGGAMIAELYDASVRPLAQAPGPRLVNVATLATFQGDTDAIIAGFTIEGFAARTVLIRAAGPALISGNAPAFALRDPVLRLYRNSTLLMENDDWGGDSRIAAAAGEVGAFAFKKTFSRDAALLVTLPPGAYTAQMSSLSERADGRYGLLEIYEVK